MALPTGAQYYWLSHHQSPNFCDQTYFFDDTLHADFILRDCDIHTFKSNGYFKECVFFYSLESQLLIEHGSCKLLRRINLDNKLQPYRCITCHQYAVCILDLVLLWWVLSCCVESGCAFWASFHLTVRHLTTKSREVSKPRDWTL